MAVVPTNCAALPTPLRGDGSWRASFRFLRTHWHNEPPPSPALRAPSPPRRGRGPGWGRGEGERFIHPIFGVGGSFFKCGVRNAELSQSLLTSAATVQGFNVQAPS